MCFDKTWGNVLLRACRMSMKGKSLRRESGVIALQPTHRAPEVLPKNAADPPYKVTHLKPQQLFIRARDWRIRIKFKEDKWHLNGLTFPPNLKAIQLKNSLEFQWLNATLQYVSRAHFGGVRRWTQKKNWQCLYSDTPT